MNSYTTTLIPTLYYVYWYNAAEEMDWMGWHGMVSDR